MSSKSFYQNKFVERMKNYEKESTEYFLPENLPICIRIRFQSLKEIKKYLSLPVDEDFEKILDSVCKSLIKKTSAFACYSFQGEISLIYNASKGSLFGLKTQKINSILASKATYLFIKECLKYDKFKEFIEDEEIFFECRSFCLPSLEEAANYLNWRKELIVSTWVTNLKQLYVEDEKGQMKRVDLKNIQNKYLNGTFYLSDRKGNESKFSIFEKAFPDLREIKNKKQVLFNNETPIKINT